MRHILTYILFLVPVSAMSQTELDYQLYSKAIDEKIDQWVLGRDIKVRVVVIEKFVPDQNYGHEFKESLYDSPIDIVHWFVGYDTLRYNLIKNNDVKKAIMHLDSVFMDTPILSSKKFAVKTSVVTIPQKKFDALFKGFFKRNFDKGWKKYYNKYPDALGVLELSRVSYSGDYACFYIGHRANPLWGNGTMYILNKENNCWKILGQFNLWYN